METIGARIKRLGQSLGMTDDTEEPMRVTYRCKWCNKAIDQRRVMAAITRGHEPSFHSNNCKSYFYKRAAKQRKRKERKQ